MSSARKKKIAGLDEVPYIGALLRMAHQEARTRLLAALAARGFGDINQAHFGLFQYPPIDGMRPIDLANRLAMSKQALNHLLGQLEKLGYLQRRRTKSTGPATVHLTERGWLVLESNVATMRQLEADWREKLGEQRFDDLKGMLKELTAAP